MASYGMAGKKGVITGGTSGIGLAAAAFLVQDGAEVLLVGKNPEKGRTALAKLDKGPGKAFYLQADLSTAAGCAAVGKKLKKANTPVDFLVNCAGIYEEQQLWDVTEEEYTRLMDTNVKSAVFVTQAVLPFLTGEGASIVNIASDAALEGNYGCSLYAATKGALVALTRSWALDFAPRIRVNCLCPGDVYTPLVEKQLQSGGYTLDDMASVYPLGRIGRPEEIAHMICAVLSPLNGFMTGSIIAADGGLTAK